MVTPVREIPEPTGDQSKPEFSVSTSSSGQHKLTIEYKGNTVVVPLDNITRTWLMDELRRVSFAIPEPCATKLHVAGTL